MEGVIYVMSNNSFMIKDHYKIGMTKDIKSRKKAYVTAFPVPCEFPYVSPVVKDVRKRERLIFHRLNEYRFNPKREYFICPIKTIKSTIKEVLQLDLKDINTELNIKETKTEWLLEVPLFFKAMLKKTKKSKYEKVDIDTLIITFKAWLRAKGIKTTSFKKFNEDDFLDKVEEKYKLKYGKQDFEYLEKVEFK